MTNSTWYKTVDKLVGGILLYTLADIASSICDLVDSASNVGDMMNMFSGRGSMGGPSGAEITGWICSVLVIVGYILFFRAIVKFSTVQTNKTDEENAVRIKQSYIFLILATLMDFIPVAGDFIALIFLIISYVKQLKGYKGLSQSKVWTSEARKGASTLHTVVVWTLIAAILGLIPLVGDAIEGIIRFILFFVVLSAWRRIQRNEPNGENVILEDEEDNDDKHVSPRSSATYYEKTARSYSIEKLEEIIGQEAMFEPKLVEACKIELQIRQDAENLREIVSQKDDYELNEILTNPSLYNAAMVYCCELILAERRREYEAEQAKLREEERQRRAEEEKARLEKEEAERKEAAERRKAFWQKWRVWIILAAIALIAVAFVCWWTSDTHRFNQGIACVEQLEYDKALEYFTMVSNKNNTHYSEAKYRLGDLYLSRQDSAKAAEAYLQSISTGKWEYPDGYRQVAKYIAEGTLTPYIEQDKVKAAYLLEKSSWSYNRVKAAELLYESGRHREAYAIFSEYNGTTDNTISANVYAYLGAMHLYGQAGLTPDAETASKYFKKVDYPSTAALCAAKANTILFLESDSYSSSYSSYRPKLADVKSLYFRAVSLSDDTYKKVYQLYYEVIEKVMEAETKHNNISFWDRGEIYWDSYSWDNGDSKGSWEGEYTYWNNGGGAHGWGWYRWLNKETYIGHTKFLKWDGLGLNIVPIGNNFYVRLGKWKNNQFVDGYFIDTDGSVDYISK